MHFVISQSFFNLFQFDGYRDDFVLPWSASDSNMKYVWVIIDTANKRILQNGLRPRAENGSLQKPQLFSQLAWPVGEHWPNGSSGILHCPEDMRIICPPQDKLS